MHLALRQYPPGAAGLALGVDSAALAGIWLAFFLAVFMAVRRRGPVEAANLFFALLGMFLLSTPGWHHVYDYGRVFTPSLLLPLAAGGFRPGIAWLPLALIVPRTLVQVFPQAVGVMCPYFWP